ncbi:hypothetical protein AB0I50_42840, partial [Streptomyces prunicolor]
KWDDQALGTSLQAGLACAEEVAPRPAAAKAPLRRRGTARARRIAADVLPPILTRAIRNGLSRS